jgi:hypothetical protein
MRSALAQSAAGSKVNTTEVLQYGNYTVIFTYNRSSTLSYEVPAGEHSAPLLASCQLRAALAAVPRQDAPAARVRVYVPKGRGSIPPDQRCVWCECHMHLADMM